VTILLPWLVPAWWRRLHRGDARYLLLLGWIALVLLFFSASAAKRGVYILPATTALALVTAPLISGLWRKTEAQSAAWAATFIIAAVFVGVALAGGVFAPSWGDKLLEGYGIEPWWLFAAVGALGIAYGIIVGRQRALLGLAVFFGVCGYVTAGGFIRYSIRCVRQRLSWHKWASASGLAHN
jgi:4-amino-4-deoxy-L-arabinose transferase-like glycosyltransferase